MKKLLLLSLIVFFFAGCSNYLGWMHQKGTSTNADALIADARSAMAKGEYSNAMNYYAKAMESDSRKSMARYGHAVAYIKSVGFNVVTLANTLATSTTSTTDYINPAKFGLATLDQLETLIDTLIADLEPIANGACDGEIKATDSEVNMAISISKVIKAGVIVKSLFEKYSGQNYSIKQNADGSFAILKNGVPDKLPSKEEAQELIDLISGSDGAKEAFQTALENAGVDIQAEGYSDINQVLNALQTALQNAMP